MRSHEHDPRPSPPTRLSPPTRPSPPTTVPLQRWRFDLFWGIATAVSAAIVAAAVLTAGTTGGRIAGGLLFGLITVACVWMWIDVRRHPPQLQVSDAAIIGGYRGKPGETSLLKDAGADLVFVLVRRQRGAHWSLAQPGNATTVDVQHFPTRRLVEACEAHGWRILEGKGPRR